ncbi:MAG TPA: Gfo/Idh/MocA family oxidoreductase [Chitinophagales bacterium]|nr:Gfo/Idh/MocA family oxidoreductase [Chitinophagales bacterium]
MIRIGVLGTGHLGKIHLKLIREIRDYELVGFYDPNDENALHAEREFGVKRFTEIESLIDAVDAVDIVTNTLSHYDCAVAAIKKSKHVFIEKPLANSLEEAKELVKLAGETKVKGMVGHVERFNPAFLAIKPYVINPMFIETHRLAQFNPRGTDVPVVLDLMIHDIDIILNVVKSPVKKISASGVSVISSSPDIANARIEFDNGCVANITASRISLKQMRKMRLFQKDGYISIDFLDKKTEIIRLSDKRDSANPFALELNTGTESRWINFERPDVMPVNSIKMELELFHDAIAKNEEPAVTLNDGFNAMSIAHQIMEKIEKQNAP